MSWTHLSNAHRDVLIRLYADCRLTVDDLPYTEEFDRLHAAFNTRTCSSLSKHEFWRAISSARKTGRLIRKER